MAKLSETYARLFQNYRKIETRMSASEPDLQLDLLSSARAIVKFEVENELPRLRELVSTHRDATGKIEVAKQKLARLETSIRNQEFFILQRFSENDTTGDALDLLGWTESSRIGANAVKALTAQASELERELREFIKAHKGCSECLEIQQSSIAWTKQERESYIREFQFESSQPAREAVAQAA